MACDDAHLAEERRRVERSPRGSDTVRVVVHASPRDAANALDAETVAVGGVDDDSGVYGSGSGARLPPPPALLMLVPAFDAGPLREAWRALATAWARRAVATDGDGGRVVALMDATRGADAAASAAAAEFAGTVARWRRCARRRTNHADGGTPSSPSPFVTRARERDGRRSGIYSRCVRDGRVRRIDDASAANERRTVGRACDTTSARRYPRAVRVRRIVVRRPG